MDNVDKRNSQRLEKRKSPRIDIDLVTVEVYLHKEAVKAEPEIIEICPIRNLSESGMMFECETRFNPGDLLRLTFALPDSPLSIRTDAIVIHAAGREIVRNRRPVQEPGDCRAQSPAPYNKQRAGGIPVNELPR